MIAARRPALALAALVLLAIGAAGCFNPFNPLLARQGSNSKPPPLPNSAAGVVSLFQWCWQNRAFDEYEEIFTDDYRFIFASGDTAGRYFLNTPWTRSDELNTAQHLFLSGTAANPPATSILLDFTQDLDIGVDPRPGKSDTTYHWLVAAQVNLRVFLADGNYDVTGPVYFNVVRGDSAIIPPVLVKRGFRPDPNRWYIERWVDGTLHGTLAATPPTVHDAAGAVTPRDRPVAASTLHAALERALAARFGPSPAIGLPAGAGAVTAASGPRGRPGMPSGGEPPPGDAVAISWGTLKVLFHDP
jgi:hypothetical protein